MARACYQERGEAYEADICQRELAALPDDAARICFLKRHRRRLMESLHAARECKIVCVNRYCMNLLYAPYWGKQR